MDEQAKAYFLDIEDHYQRTVGRPLILSPKDLEAVSSWWERGVPLQAALRGITRYIERIQDDPRKRKRRLAVRYAENDVLDAAEDYRTSRAGDRRGDGLEDRARILELFAGIGEQLASSAAGPLAAMDLEDLAAQLQGLRDAYQAGSLSVEDVEERLGELDLRLLSETRRVLGNEALKMLRKEAEGRLSDARQSLGEEAWEKTVALLEEKLLREQYGIPRLSLYGY